MAKKTKVDKKVDKIIKTFTKHEQAIKTIREIIDIYNRNWEYLQNKHTEYTRDDTEWGDGTEIPTEHEAIKAFQQITKIK